MKKELLGTILTLSMMTTLLAGCGGQAADPPVPSAAPPVEHTASPTPDQSEPQAGGILYVNDSGNKAILGYPPKFSSASIIRHVSPCIETLFRYDDTGSPAPFLAEGYDADVNALTLTIQLREGITFHDGTSLNAEAVKWNFDEQIAGGVAAFNSFTSIETPDEHTVVIHLNSWNNALLSQLCSYPGMMISPETCKANGAEWAMNNPVGTGPFRFVSWEKDVKIVYEKNENYWQEGLPYLDGIEISFTADDTSRELSMRNGNIDVLIQGGTTTVQNLVAAGFVKVSEAAGTGGQSLVPDSDNPDSPWADARVRQAAAYAIDTDAIVDGILGGVGVKTNQYSYPGHWGYNESLVGYSIDLDKAKSLLSEAGYANGFETSLTYNVSSDDADLVATAIQSMLSQVGIQATLNPVQDALHVEMERQGGGWDGLLQIGANPNPDTAEQMKARLWGDGKWLKSMIHTPEMQAAIDEALAAAEFEEKQQKVWAVQNMIFGDECLMIPLYISMDTCVLSPTVYQTGFSSRLPAVSWTPELAWKAAA